MITVNVQVEASTFQYQKRIFTSGLKQGFPCDFFWRLFGPLLLGTIQILRKQVFGHFQTHPPTHYVSIIYVLNVSKNGHFLNPPTQSYAYVIYEWSLRFSLK